MIRPTSKQNIHGANFWRLVAEAGLKPSDIARMTGVSDQVVYGWLKRGVSAKSASEVALILDCDPTFISNMSRLRVGEKRHAKSNIQSVPVINWQDIPKLPLALAASNQLAVFLIENDLNTACYALICSLTPGLHCTPGYGVSSAILVDPSITDLKTSKFGFIIQGPSDPLPLFRQVESSGGDHYLVTVDPRYPTPPTPLTPDHKILGTVICAGITSEPSLAPTINK